MSTHIGAEKGQIAETVLLPGDPLRAKFIADTYLEDVICYNKVRGMYGFTGTYKGKRVSVQGTGMGLPSISIYTNELMNEYGVKRLIRIGSAGALREDVKVRDIVLAMSSCHDSNINANRFPNMTFAPTANFELLKKAYDVSVKKGIIPKVGPVFSTDSFYNDYKNAAKDMAAYGCMAVEMESAALYTLAAKYNREALTILTISDSLVTGEETTAEERQNTFTQMMEIALELA